jgi:hypothetical protein
LGHDDEKQSGNKQNCKLPKRGVELEACSGSPDFTVTRRISHGSIQVSYMEYTSASSYTPDTTPLEDVGPDTAYIPLVDVIPPLIGKHLPAPVYGGIKLAPFP